jgi:FemAB-related protein (PEP-CTERM system-associated)
VSELKPARDLHTSGSAVAIAAKTAPLVVRPFQDDHEAWDRFVCEHSSGSPFHLTAWKKSIEQTFGYESKYLVVVQGSRIRGVLPLFLVKNLLLGKVLISSPFAVYGGILADSDGAREALCTHVRHMGESLGVQYVELRNAAEEQCTGLPRITRYVTFTQSIGPDERAILESIPRKTRYMVRKALEKDLKTRHQVSDPTTFADLYSRNLRKLGTPSFPTRFFQTLLENFRGMADIREVMLGDKVVAAVLSFYFSDQVLPYYGASDPQFNTLAPNNFMYFDLMRWGGQNGYSIFDFGRSKKVKGSYDFKSHWGMMERELPYELMLIKRKQIPNYTPTNPVFQLPILCWQRLPLSVTRILGPLLVRLVP